MSSEYFSDHSELRAFSPGEGLARVISHYWILRWDLPEGLVYRPMEALGAPVVNIFFTFSEGFLYGISPGMIEYEARHKDVIAGVTFQPGGFRPYWGKPMHTLPAGKTPLEAVFPHANTEFRRRLLAIPEDSALAAELDAFFRGIRIENSLHGSAVQSILQNIGVRRDLRSVPAVSRAFGIPERTLQHIFRDEVGASLRWILLRARLLDAVAESFDLEQPDWAGIAYKHGYSSQAHFITDFKRVFGVTPEGYRRSDTGRIPGKA